MPRALGDSEAEVILISSDDDDDDDSDKCASKSDISLPIHGELFESATRSEDAEPGCGLPGKSLHLLPQITHF